MTTIVSVVVGIIQDPISKKILITQRSKDQHLADLWEFPGGKVEKDETFFEALGREIDEEVDLKVSSAYLLKQLTHDYGDKVVFLSFYVISTYQGKAFAKEGQAMKWVDLNELDQYQFPEANIPIIKSLSLSKFWMITPNCELDNSEEFIGLIKSSIKCFQVDQILFRSKNLSDKDYFLVCEKLKNDKDLINVSFIFNREEIDLKMGNAWHLTSKQLYNFTKRPYDEGFLSASCHTLEDIKQAEKIQCDCILLSAVQKTKSHPDTSALGWSTFKKLSNQTTLPVYALGGVKREDIAVAQYQGAIGIAGISTFIERNE